MAFVSTALRSAAILLFGLALVPVASAFTASNTGHPAGEGVAGVSGYMISNIHFVPASDASRLSAVSFEIAPAAATTVRVQLSKGSVWYVCRNTAGHVACPTASEPAVAAATALSVVAYG
jgi:hypothetical protein